MELDGTFIGAEFLAGIISGFSQEEASGVLMLQAGGSTTHLVFRSGHLTGSSNESRPMRLGQILLNRGVIDRGALEEALMYQSDFSPGTPLGKVLLHRELITGENLVDALEHQLEEELWEALLHVEGSYQFLKQPDNGDAPLVMVDPKPILQKILERRQEWELIRLRIDSEDLVPAVQRLENPSDREMLQLNEREWQVLSLVNGYYNVGCIAARTGMGRFESYKILSMLMSTGLVELRKMKDLVRVPDKAERPADDDSPTGSSSSPRWANILTRLRDPEKFDDAADRQKLSFDSPVSFITTIANRIVEKFASMPEFQAAGVESDLAEKYWRSALMACPKADLVKAQGNKLEGHSFDKYVATLGVQGTMKSIYLETMDALNRYLRYLYELGCQRVGVKQARAVFVNVMEDFRQRSSIGHSELFFFKEYVEKVFV